MRGCGLDSTGLGYCPRWAVVNMTINLWLPYNCAQFIDVLIERQPLEKDSAECRCKGREHVRVCGWGRNKAHCCYASQSGWGVLDTIHAFDGCDWFLRRLTSLLYVKWMRQTDSHEWRLYGDLEGSCRCISKYCSKTFVRRDWEEPWVNSG
jgi:hypothetical protein